MEFFETSDKKIVLTWSGPSSDVSGYRVVVIPVDDAGSPQRELSLPVSQNTYTEVTDLQPGTLYRFNIYSIHNGKESFPLTGEHTTSEFDRIYYCICIYLNVYIYLILYFHHIVL